MKKVKCLKHFLCGSQCYSPNDIATFEDAVADRFIAEKAAVLYTEPKPEPKKAEPKPEEKPKPKA